MPTRPGSERLAQLSAAPKHGAEESRVKRAEQYMTLARSVVYTLVIAVLGVFAGLLFVRELDRDPLTIEPISVPPSLVKRGYTAEVVGSRLADRVQQVYAEANSARPRLGLQRASQRPDVQVPGVGLSFQSVVNFARDFARRPETRVRGEITLEGTRLKLWLRSTTGTASSVGPLAEGEFDRLIERGGLEVVKLTTPQIAADYFYDREEVACRERAKCEFPETLSAIQLAIASGSKDDRKGAEFLWGYLLGVSQNEKEEAIKHYKEAIRIDKDFQMAHNNMAAMYIDLGRPRDAEPSAREAIRLNPKSDLAHDNLGQALRDLNRPMEALGEHRKTVALNPDYGNAYISWGVTLAALKCPKQALEKYQQGVAMIPAQAVTFYWWGNFLRGLGLVDEALEKYRTAVAMSPKQEFKDTLRETVRLRANFEKDAKERLQTAPPGHASCEEYASPVAGAPQG